MRKSDRDIRSACRNFTIVIYGVCFPNLRENRDGVQLAMDRVNQIDFTLLPGKQIEGHVTDPAGRPIPGATVFAYGITVPIMGMARVNVPSLMIYGGTIRAGHTSDGTPLDIVSAFQSYGEWIADRITDDARRDIVNHACPGAKSPHPPFLIVCILNKQDKIQEF